MLNRCKNNLLARFWISLTAPGNYPQLENCSHCLAQRSETFAVLTCSTELGQNWFASFPVQVLTATNFQRSSDAGSGGWSKANTSRFMLGQNCEGSVPDIEQIALSKIPAGRGNSGESLPETIGTACE